jgi:hypothetical protein
MQLAMAATAKLKAKSTYREQRAAFLLRAALISRECAPLGR